MLCLLVFHVLYAVNDEALSMTASDSFTPTTGAIKNSYLPLEKTSRTSSRNIQYRL